MQTFLPRRDLILALLVIIIWGGHFAVIKAGVMQMHPLVALTLRFGLTGLLFLPFAKMPDRKTFRRIIEIGILMGVLHQGLLFWGIQLIDPASVAVLMQSQTVFAVVLGWLLLGEKFAWRTTLGLGLSAIGLIVMLGVPDVAASPKGFGILMASSMVLSYSYIRMRKMGKVHPASFIAILNLTSFPIAGLFSLAFGGVAAWRHLPDVDWAIMGAVLAYQVLVVSLSHTWWQQLLSRNEVAKVTCFTLLTPPIAIAVAMIFTGTQLTLPLVVGTLLITAGLGVVVIRRVQKKRNEPVTLVE